MNQIRTSVTPGAAAKAGRLAAAGATWLILGLNLLFVLAFFVVLFTMPVKAKAGTVACTGTNLLDGLDPATLQTMRDEAAAIPNGEALLWKVERDGIEPSWLFGTMHMTDPRVVALTPPAQAAFDASKTVVIETTDILDQNVMVATIMRHPELTMFGGSESLTGLIPPAELPAVEKALEERGIPLASVAKMKPWMLSAVVALPACELARKDSGDPVLDVKLATDARADGKSVEGLETAISQLEAMASLPMEFHVRGLIDTLKLGDRIDDVVETMIVIYETGETGLFWPMMKTVMPEAPDGSGGYAEFEQTMVTARNGTMADRARPIIDRGGAFIAVGALHLPGPDGVVERLRRAGYTVTAAK